jgi:hypothetical protein
LREHDAVAALPLLSLRSLRLLVSDRSWLLGFATESTGFVSYAAALALAPLAVVQSIEAGGIGVLAYDRRRRPEDREAKHVGVPSERRTQLGERTGLAAQPD